jgi:hypothetical protein
MYRPGRNEWYYFAGVLLLTAAEYLLKFVQIRAGGYELSNSIIRGTLFILLFSCWGRTLSRRVIHSEIRRYLMAEMFLMVFWVFIRTVKYTDWFNVPAKIYLWYLFYVPILFIPFFAVRISYYLGRPENDTLPHRSRIIYLIPLLLLTFILTNNAHRLVFVFLKETPDDRSYSYGLGYLAVLVWIAVCIGIAICRMIRHNRRTGNRKWLYLPLIPVLLLFAYSGIYALHGSLLETFKINDVSVICCLLVFLSFELCLQVGLIPSNARYRELFLNAGLPVGIYDEDLQPYLLSRAFCEPEEGALHAALEEPLILQDGSRMVSSRISGGYSFWQEDIREAARMLEELADMNESLTESSIAARKAYETRKERQRLTERNSLYDTMQREVRDKMRTVQELVNQFEMEDDPEAEREYLLKILLLGIYIKRRSNLFFLSQESGRIAREELEYCLEETFVYLRMSGIVCGYEVLGDTDISFRGACRIYDFFEAVMEEDFNRFRSVYVSIRQQEEGWEILTEVQSQDPGFFDRINGRSEYAEDEGDGTVLLSLHVAEGGERR